MVRFLLARQLVLRLVLLLKYRMVPIDPQWLLCVIQLLLSLNGLLLLLLLRIRSSIECIESIPVLWG